MDNFEDLTNNELRDKLKAHNLGNFPVTDTTRNALIKKLRNALNGPAKPVKGRRETMNVVKHSSAEESESDAELKKINKPKTAANRRATIAATAPKPLNITNGVNDVPISKPAPLPKAVAPPKIVPVTKTPTKAAPVSVRPKSPARKSVQPENISYFADASDDDLVAAAEEAEKQSRRRASRTSRSPSLTKSSVVTTSYKHTIEPLIENKYDDDDIILINDNSDAEYSSDMLEKVRKPSTPTTKIQPPSDRRKTMQLGPSISTNFTSFKPTEKPVEDSGAYKRRYTTYTASTTTTPLNLRHEKNLDDSSDDILNKVETPFLSDFTRRLAQLKAEQLPGTETSFEYKSPKATTSSYMNEYRSSVYGSSRVGDRYRSSHPVTTSSSITKPTKPSALSTWEKKFRWPLLFVVGIFVAVSVYVFLFTNF